MTSKPTSNTLRPLALAVHLALAVAVLTPPAHAQAQQWQLPAGELAQSLQRLASQANVALVVDSRQLQGKQAPALQGSLSIETALDTLLVGSGFVAVRTAQGYSIKPVAELPKVKVSATAPAQTSNRTVAAGVNEAQLETVRVSAAANLGGSEATATSPVKGYVAKRSATATKTDTPIVETPQSISVVGAEEIEAIGAKRLIEALGYTSGIVNLSGSDPTTESFALRGFQQRGKSLRDGLAYGGAWGNAAYQELYGVERVEYLKGAASVLYGQQSPGGVVNSVSKRPRADLVQELVAEVGSFNHQAVKADLGGEINDELLWRFTALTNRANSQVDYVDSDRVYLAPSLQWQPSASTKITLLPYYQKSDLGMEYQLPYQGTVQPNKWGTVPRSRFLGEPNEGDFPNTNWGIGAELDHEFKDGSKLSGNFRLNKNEITWNYSMPIRLDADQRSLYRYATRNYTAKDSNANGDVRFAKTINFSGIIHKLLAGVDYSKEHVTTASGVWSTANFGPIDLFNPVYGNAPDFINTGFENSKYDFQNQAFGAYLQDQISVGDHWRILLGGRQSWVKQVDNAAKVTQRNKQFSTNAGVVYLGSNGISPYASFSQSFQQEIGKLQDGSAMKPTEGEQFEAGIRWQPRGENGPLLSLSTYQLTKTNVAKSNPATPGFSIQVGAIRSRGVELEAKGSFTKHLSGSIGYAYTDARTTRSTTASEIGQRTGGVPLHQASAWLDVDGGLFNLTGLKFGAGVRYVGELPIEGETFTVPDKTELDARLSYKLRNWQYDLNVTNLLDKVGYTNCAWGRCGFTKARTITGSVAYRF